MTSQKGDTLVRPPPPPLGTVGAMPLYPGHLGAPWDHNDPLVILPQQLAAKDILRNSSTTSTESVLCSRAPQDDASEFLCLKRPQSESLVRVLQLEHDLEELKWSHQTILEGLHFQLEELKEKNKDMTFRLLMEQYFQQNQSSETLDESGISCPGLREQIESSTQTEVLLEEEEDSFAILRTGASPHVPDIQSLKLLEAEVAQTKILLQEEQSKNRRLQKVVQDLKGQIEALQKSSAPLVQESDIKSRTSEGKLLESCDIEGEMLCPVQQEGQGSRNVTQLSQAKRSLTVLPVILDEKLGPQQPSHQGDPEFRSMKDIRLPDISLRSSFIGKEWSAYQDSIRELEAHKPSKRGVQNSVKLDSSEPKAENISQTSWKEKAESLHEGFSTSRRKNRRRGRRRAEKAKKNNPNCPKTSEFKDE